MRLFSLLFSAALLCAVTAAAPPAAAQMEGSVLFVAPHRLIITPGTRADTISVSNKSDRERRYDLSMIDQIMTDKGVTKRIEDDSFVYSVKKMVSYTPRRFTLKPGESQVVRVKVDRPPNLSDGDYHSHLLFREVPLSRKDKEKLQEERELAEKTVSFEIRTLYGIAVPIVVQHGKINSDIGLANLALGAGAGGRKAVSIGFTRSGNSEASGKLSAEYVKGGAKPVTVIEPQWIRMYRESESITKSFNLTNLPSGASGGKIIVHLMRDETDPKKTVTKELSLN